MPCHCQAQGRLKCPILDRMSLWFCVLCNFPRYSDRSIKTYMIQRNFYFFTNRSDGLIIPLHEGYCCCCFCVYQSVLLQCFAETQTKHSQMVNVNFNSCWPFQCLCLSSHFLEIISSKQGKFDGSREQLNKCLF